MIRIISAIAVCITLSLAVAQSAQAHCQIPCGIYGDEMRFDMLEEHFTTIEKSMKLIVELGKEDKNKNQIVRWVMNKEKHADEVVGIITDYFLMQRIKAAPAKSKAYNGYLNNLRLLHGILVQSMKAKQTTDLTHVKHLRAHTAEFKKLYLKGHSHKK